MLGMFAQKIAEPDVPSPLRIVGVQQVDVHGTAVTVSAREH
jgi:hypothetical protein